MSTLALSLEEMGFEVGEAQAVFLLIIFRSGWPDQPSLDFGFFAFEALARDEGSRGGVRGGAELRAGAAPSVFFAPPPPPQSQLPSVTSL